MSSSTWNTVDRMVGADAPRSLRIIDRGFWGGPLRYQLLWDGPEGLIRWETGATLKRALKRARDRNWDRKEDQ